MSQSERYDSSPAYTVLATPYALRAYFSGDYCDCTPASVDPNCEHLRIRALTNNQLLHAAQWILNRETLMDQYRHDLMVTILNIAEEEPHRMN